MSLKASLQKRTFNFGFAARTSRGAMREKNSWFVKIYDAPSPEVFGLGECGPLPGLSREGLPGLEPLLEQLVNKINEANFSLPEFSNDGSERIRQAYDWLTKIFGLPLLEQNPAITFAFETAVLDLAGGGSKKIFDNAFVRGEPIPINGLVWMGGLDYMLQQVEIKIRDGFSCVKIKVGGLDFERECDILQYIRRKYFRETITVRLDANGAFKTEEVLYKLNAFARFGIHSIEQPIKAGVPELSQLCRESPIPIALDEELIGISGREAKEELLERIKPAYIIVKPTLHGGFFGCDEWIRIAEERKVGWWITSALESSIGLNAISQFTANYPISIPQGLGTGEIYTNNISSPLQVKKGFLSYNKEEPWEEIIGF
jgi:o-succinylbenzoate synthase